MIEKQILINDILLNYKVFQCNKPKETFLILHGWGGKSDSWIDVGTKLNLQNYNVIVPDLPGFGKTILKKVYTLDDYVILIKAFILKLKLKNIILIGHSNGGAISIKLINKKSTSIKKLILNNSAGIRNNKKRSLKRKILNKITKIIPTFLKKNNFIKKFCYKIIGGQDYLNSEKIPFLKETYKNMISSDLQEDMNKINKKTTLIWGEHDTYTPVSDGKRINALISNSSLIILENERHGIHLQNPNKLVKTILENIQ